jgi:hypothetical protein
MPETFLAWLSEADGGGVLGFGGKGNGVGVFGVRELDE